MTLFVDTGSVVYQTPSDIPTITTIPPGTYTLGFDPENVPGGFFLKRINNFTLPSKVYGNNNKYSDIILNTFLKETTRPTTAALAGLKGSGKSLCSKEICIKALERDIPTIVVGQDYAGPSLNTWLQNINQPCIVFIDEFEKVYVEQKKRDQLLTLLDGAYNSHKLFLLTMNAPLNNEKFPYFFNRPGRVYYNIAFGPITQDVIKEYCEDHLVDKTKLNEILTFTNRFSEFTIDILTILVKELNTNPTFTCQDVTDIVNIKPDVKADQLFFKTEAFFFDSVNETLQPLTVAFTRSETATKNTIVLDFSFARDFLSGDSATLYRPIFTLEEYNRLASVHSSVNGYPIMSFNMTLDPSCYDLTDSEGRKEFETEVKKYKNKPIGWVYYNVSLNEKSSLSTYTEHSQNPETRAVTIKHPLSGTIITLSVESRSQKPLAYTF